MHCTGSRGQGGQASVNNEEKIVLGHKTHTVKSNGNIRSRDRGEEVLLIRKAAQGSGVGDKHAVQAVCLAAHQTHTITGTPASLSSSVKSFMSSRLASSMRSASAESITNTIASVLSCSKAD